ncbi:MAG: hypothetical protein LBF67_08485 [Prevotellaceae bacterium]|jgi:hypothetical protein|nr:hypothetical protein [Prevotellaceae bacterium]
MIFHLPKKCLLFLTACTPFFAAAHQELNERERLLKAAIRRVAEATNAAQKLALNSAFSAQLEQALRQDSAFFYAFDSIPYLYKVASPDGLVRIITWNVPVDGGQKYFGFVLLRIAANTAHATLHVLHDKRMPTRLVEGKALSVGEWFGALYIKLVEKRNERTGKPVYTLLGISPGNDGVSNKKVVDVLNVDNSGACSFGAPVFAQKTKITYRMIFEYSAAAVMDLRYHEGTGQIIFSSLVPMYAQLRGRYEQYIPNDAHNALRFENGRWVFYENIEPPSSVTVRRWRGRSR